LSCARSNDVALAAARRDVGQRPRGLPRRRRRMGSWSCPHALMMPSWLAKHPVIADDGDVVLFRRLDAPLFETALEESARLKPRNRTGPVLGLCDAEMNERAVAEP